MTTTASGSGGAAVELADALYANVDLNPGYEYQDDAGVVHGPFPAIALFTWGLKGVFSPTRSIRRAGRREFHPLADLQREIAVVARLQLTNVLVQRKEWFYLDREQEVQGECSAEKLLSYIGNRYFKESTKLYGRPVQQDSVPKPSPNDPGFRTYGELLDETLTDYRSRMQEWRERTYTPAPSVNGNGTIHAQNGRTEVLASEPPPPLPVLTPLPPELTLEELRERYGAELFSEQSGNWYMLHEGAIYGPYPTLEPYLAHMPGASQLCNVPQGGSTPQDPSLFRSLEDHLKQLHLNS